MVTQRVQKDSNAVCGDPCNETAVLLAIQGFFRNKQRAWNSTLVAARTLSHFGEHALGWMGVSALGYTLSRFCAKDSSPRVRRGWLAVGIAAFASHAASVVVKRIVRRPRPHDPAIHIGVATPSQLSFPSSHATSSTAALVAMSDMSGRKLPLMGVVMMAFSRMVLGVHYPSDVATGTLLGWISAKIVRRILVTPRLAGETRKDKIRRTCRGVQ